MTTLTAEPEGAESAEAERAVATLTAEPEAETAEAEPAVATLTAEPEAETAEAEPAIETTAEILIAEPMIEETPADPDPDPGTAVATTLTADPKPEPETAVPTLVSEPEPEPDPEPETAVPTLTVDREPETTPLTADEPATATAVPTLTAEPALETTPSDPGLGPEPRTAVATLTAEPETDPATRSGTPPDAPPITAPETPQMPPGEEAAALPLSGRIPFGRTAGGVSVPAPPAATPRPAVPARIPYREWKGRRPRAVGLSFAAIVMAGIISLGGGIAASRAPVTEPPAYAGLLEIFGVDAAEYVTTIQTVTLATALVVFGLYLLVAVLIREGRNWARIGASVLAPMALVATMQAAAVLQVFAVLVAIAGLSLLYLDECNRYFRPRRSRYLSMR
ncbi:hypothetical protein QNO08_14935 [Arthrobacter sp. zg-Y820]|uniref:hypothetical protein n=1 Tax=unclassified Arthrobacter TaxID=235627 RepID=UPI001E2E4DAB|nr:MULTISPECIES: hypothetical protein [unclassified Arthrobacter]MCC9195595.1 hypothetical protein [Arthrobacter sp. zg-Y820]MDK1278454.1 hypothetical protein [Arthrobacter sp. zg.Y820]WIB09107.1 hypothetical protein QNO08_14935 [Arthrobacter sp. zg-Y820]